MRRKILKIQNSNNIKAPKSDASQWLKPNLLVIIP